MNLVPYHNESHDLILPPQVFTSERGDSIEVIAGAWLYSIEQKSHSTKTQTAYRDTLTDFRLMLLQQGRDLLWRDANFVPTVADFAQVFAAQRSPRSRHKGPISRATQAQRLAILSSFYSFAIKRGHISTANPIDRIDKPSVEAYSGAHAIDQEEVEARLKAIDGKTLQGARDLALLTVLLQTGRRVSEVASLQRKHLQLVGKQVRLTFERAKGGKEMRDTLPAPVARVLVNWLVKFYGDRFIGLPGDTPLWVNVHHKKHYGEALGYHGVAGICQHYLGTSKVHTTRHTFAVLMEIAGASLTDIQQRLGHKNAATTGIYMEKLNQDKNKYADRLSALLGFEE